MSAYMLLCNFTDQGVRTIKEVPQRRAAARELGKKLGVDIKAGYLAMGTYDLIIHTEATDDVLQRELLRRPKNKGTFLAQWQATRAWQLSLDVLAVGTWVDGNRDFSIPRLDAPGYTTVNFATSYDLTPHLVVFGRINNLFDRHYENPVGFLQPSFGAYAGIKVTFGGVP